MAAGAEISGNKDPHDQRLDFGWCSLAGGTIGARISAAALDLGFHRRYPVRPGAFFPEAAWP